MNAPAKPQEFSVHFHPRRGDGALADLLRREIEGDVLFDRFSRGRYSTDASIYQVDPVGVVIPRNERDSRPKKIAWPTGCASRRGWAP
jgi:hypothetical protein